VSGSGPVAAPRSRASLGRTTLLMTPLQLVLRLTEAAFPLFLAAWFGSSAETDAYVLTATVFGLAGALLFSAYRDSAIVPVLTEVRLRRPRELARVQGALVVHTALVALACAALVAVPVAIWFQLRYPPPLRALALSFILPFGLHLVCCTLGFLLVALLHVAHRFAIAAIASAIGKATTLTALALVHEQTGVVGIPWCQAAGEAVAVLALALFALRVARLRIQLDTSRPEPLRRFAALALAQVAGGAMTRLNPLVDQLFATFLAVAGGATLLKLTADAAGAPTSLLQAALLPVLLSHLSEDFTRGDLPRFRRTVARSLRMVLPLLAIVSALIILLHRPLLTLLFQRGAMTAADIDRMGLLFVCHVVGVVPFGALLLLARAHVAAGNTRLLLPLGALNAGLNLVLNLLLSGPLGLAGIALATSATHAVVAAVFGWRLRQLLAAGSAPALQGGPTARTRNSQLPSRATTGSRRSGDSGRRPGWPRTST
jgi:putative peptidoglycan lipid II flippase